MAEHLEVQFFLAGEADEILVRSLMKEFYEREKLPYRDEVASLALGELWRDPSIGRVFVMKCESVISGYAVLTFGFSLEFHGRDALVDELYVREAYRGKGIGTRCLEWIEAVCRAEGIHAMHLEVDHTNLRAKSLYHRFGYREHDRHLLTKWLSA